MDPRLRQLYNPQLADRSRLEARQARRIVLAARAQHEIELRSPEELGGVARPGDSRPRLAVVALALIAVVVLAVVLAASTGVL